MHQNTFEILGKIFRAAVDDNITIEPKYQDDVEIFKSLVATLMQTNGWFYPEFVALQLKSLSNMLNKESLDRFCARYKLRVSEPKEKRVKLIPAGNIPLVGFHDIFCILMSGCKCVYRPSTKDNILPRQAIKTIIKINPQLSDRIIIEENTQEKFDAIIATGSNNSSRYFDYYFAKYPHIIRRNRNSVAVLYGDETSNDYQKLADDIFAYYGLGCRSVSKIYVPKGYNFDNFFANIIHKSDVMKNPKYSDNYTYNKAIYLMSEQKILDNNFVLLKEDKALNSPIGVIFAEIYDNIQTLGNQLTNIVDDLQCVVSNHEIPGIKTVKLGEAQNPDILDYADNVDTMEFLLKL